MGIDWKSAVSSRGEDLAYSGVWPMKKYVWPIFLTLVFLSSAGLIGYSWLVFQISRGVAAVDRGEMDAAAGIFELAETPFRKVPWLSRILEDDYRKLTFDQVNVLFAQGESEVILDRLEEAVRNSPPIKDQGEFAFWIGNLLFRRAAASEDGEEALGYLKSALAEYQRGLTVAPEDWDLKYNYEALRQILAQKDQDGKKQGEKVKSLLDKMRPAPEKKQDIAPEKLG
jgi:tetratricopeptide (TPR) repeat protein